MTAHDPLPPIDAEPEIKAAARRLPHEVLVALPPEIARHRILDVKQTAAFIGFSVPQTRRLYREKKMPAPLKLSARKLGFRIGDLVDWMAARSGS